MAKVEICSIVDRQLPEFVREEYPTFVAFVQAYYEFLRSQQINLEEIKDLDKTLDVFIEDFKKELAYNMPTLLSDERQVLQHVKDHYLAKGSAASYKLLFRLMFGKDVQISYPGQQMLIASDGRWNQDSSIFAKVIFGDPDEIVGKVVQIEEGNKILRVQVNKKLDLQGEIDRIVALGGDVYEFFLDKKIYGKINVGNILRYEDSFKATILATTSVLKIYEAGQGFRVGQVFEIKSSTGTGTLMKVTRINAVGGIVHAQIIRFGVGYIADFTASILPSDSITSRTLIQEEENISTITVDSGSGPIIVGLEPEVNINELGFINTVDYVVSDYVDGAYSGTLLKEFSFDAQNIPSNIKPAIIEINLDALAKYPGYYETNNGFLSDSIYIQDSKYYQVYSYVLKIDERLAAYKTAVKTMIHPAGVALFGEFEISNKFDLAVELESLVKSLGIGVEEPELIVEDYKLLHIFKELSSNPVYITEPINNNFIGGGASNITSIIGKNFTGINGDSVAISDAEPVSKTFTSIKNDQVLISEDLDASVGLSLSHSQLIDDNELTREVSTSLTSPTQYLDETVMVLDMNGTKYMNLPIQHIFQQEFGYVVLDPYEEGNYFSEIYVNNRDAIFSS